MGWPKGQSGNPSGYSLVQRRLYKRFFTETYRVWQDKGEECLRRMAEDDPGGFCKLVAGTMPKSIDMAVDVTEQRKVSLEVLLADLSKVIEKIGIDNIQQLPHMRENIEEADVIDEREKIQNKRV